MVSCTLPSNGVEYLPKPAALTSRASVARDFRVNRSKI